MPDGAKQLFEILAKQKAQDAAQPVAELVGELVEKAQLLARKEIELARTELKADLTRELAAGKGLAAAGLLALLGVNALVMAGVLALGLVIPAWLSAVLVAAVLLAAAASVFVWAWQGRVTTPLRFTRESASEDLQWAKHRLGAKHDA